MALCVCVIKNRKYQYVRVCRAYRNEKGQPTSETIENHGRLDECLKKDPNYVETLRERIAKQNALQKEVEAKLFQDQLAENTQRLIDAKNQSSTDALNDYSSCRRLNIGVAVIKRVWDQLNLSSSFQYLQSKTKVKYRYDHLAFMLSALRILLPSSKLRAYQHRNDYIVDFSEFDNLKTVYNVLNRLAQDKQAIVRSLNRQISKLTKRDLTLAFYDVTTYGFESQAQSELKDFGLSKANKVNEVQVVLGLVMDSNGIPVDYDLLPGNTSEFGTMIPIIERVKQTYNIDRLTVVADRGLNSSENLSKLKLMNCDFVIAQKIRNCSQEIQDEILDEANWEQTVFDEQTGEVFCRYKHLSVPRELRETKISPKTGKKYNTSKIIETMDVNWVVSYSPKRAHKDNADTDRLVSKAQKAIDNKLSLVSSRGYRALLKVPKTNENVQLDLAKIADRRKWAGYYAVCTNLPVDDHQKIMSMYRQLWQIEDCFRTSKTWLETRPCFVWTDEHIQGHFMSCYLALTIERLMKFLVRQAGLQISSEALLQTLRTASVTPVSNTSKSAVVYQKMDVDQYFDDVCEVFGLGRLHRYESRGGLLKALKLKSARSE